ncbi:MAG: asparaginase [Actinobacteria bacterium]|nr:asparaginase [Actinomycetota bacterium]
MSVVLAQLVRSGLVESTHSGYLIILGPDGSDLLTLGDVDAEMYPRSAIKSLQAAAMVRHGLELNDEQLALVCASHGGSERHQEVALEILKSVGLSESDLQNTPDRPIDRKARISWGTKPATALAANCSGKHAGMLATCVVNGWDTKTYRNANHPLQIAIANEIQELTGQLINRTSVDGCGAPLFSMSTRSIAVGARKMRIASDPVFTKIIGACLMHPEMILAEGAFDTRMMRAVPGLLVKGGAESVMLASLADGSAIAWKISDGSNRANGPMMKAVLVKLGITIENEVVDVLGGGTIIGSLSATF